jgi:hypothetical protein
VEIIFVCIIKVGTEAWRQLYEKRHNLDSSSNGTKL